MKVKEKDDKFKFKSKDWILKKKQSQRKHVNKIFKKLKINFFKTFLGKRSS